MQLVPCNSEISIFSAAVPLNRLYGLGSPRRMLIELYVAVRPPQASSSDVATTVPVKKNFSTFLLSAAAVASDAINMASDWHRYFLGIKRYGIGYYLARLLVWHLDAMVWHLDGIVWCPNAYIQKHKNY